MRIIFTVILFGGLLVGCADKNTCVLVGSGNEFGTNHLAKVEQVSEFVTELGLAIAKEQVAIIVGMAYASSQIEGGQAGVPVNICFRLNASDMPEFRFLSTNGKPLIGWQVATN